MPSAVAKLHAKYGDVVRTAPDEVSVIDPGAWRDMMAPRKERERGGMMAKDGAFVFSSTDESLRMMMFRKHACMLTEK